MTDNLPEPRTKIEAAALRLRPVFDELVDDATAFTRALIVATQKTPALADCTPASVIGAALTAAQLRLMPTPELGQAWLIPYRNHGKLECQFQLGYKGMIVLADRAGWTVTAGIVRPGDQFDYRLGTDPYVDHRPTHRTGAQPPGIAWWAAATNVDGKTHVVVLDKAEVERRRGHSKAPDKPGQAWHDHYDQMARKTSVRALWSELPASPAMRAAIDADGTVINRPAARPVRLSDRPQDDGQVIDVDPVPDDPPPPPDEPVGHDGERVPF